MVTGVAGYGMMALDNAGGWQLVAGANSRGGVVQTQDGGKYKANLDDPTVADQLQLLKDMRFTDNSILPRTDLGWGDINQAFAAGELAMYTSGSTGKPRAVLLEHRGVVNHNLAVADRCRPVPETSRPSTRKSRPTAS